MISCDDKTVAIATATTTHSTDTCHYLPLSETWDDIIPAKSLAILLRDPSPSNLDNYKKYALPEFRAQNGSFLLAKLISTGLLTLFDKEDTQVW